MTEEQRKLAEKIAAAEERSAKARKEAAAAAKDQVEYDEKLTLSQKEVYQLNQLVEINI